MRDAILTLAILSLLVVVGTYLAVDLILAARRIRRYHREEQEEFDAQTK